MKKNFLEKFIDQQTKTSRTFKKIKNKISYSQNTYCKNSMFNRKFKLTLQLVGIFILLAVIIIVFIPKALFGTNDTPSTYPNENPPVSIITPPNPPGPSSNKCSLSLDSKTGDKIVTDYYEEGQEIELPIVERKGYYFVGWRDVDNDRLYAHKDGKIESITITNDTELEAYWMKLIYDFNGIIYRIIVDDKRKYDPFDENYLYSDKVAKQVHQKLVEKEFNLKIMYVEWENHENEIEIVNQIKMHIIDRHYMTNNIFAAVVPSKFVSNLGSNKYITELYDINSSEGIFSDLEIAQGELNNTLTSLYSKVYGYNNSSIYGEQYIYYNKTKVKELGLEDPLVMWMSGKWTQQNFELWLESAQGKLSENEYVLDINYSDYVMGISAASGINLTFAPRTTVDFTSKEVINIYKQMRTYYNNGWWNDKQVEEDVSNKFIENKTLLHSGYLYYLNDERYFGSNIDFEIGVIPYPVLDNSNIVMTEPFEINLINDNKVIYENPVQVNGEVLKTDEGKSIYGINIGNSSYKNRSLEGSIYDNDSCVVLFNFEYEDFSQKDLLHVIKRLSEVESYITENERFIQYLKDNKLSELNIDVILSTQNKESIEIEILNNLDFHLSLKSSSSSITNLYSVSHLLVTTEESIALVLRNLENGYKSILK